MKINDFYKKYKKDLKLQLHVGRKGLCKEITLAEVQRPGLSLTGYLKESAPKRLLVMGKAELAYLEDLSEHLRIQRLKKVLSLKTPALFLGRSSFPPKGMGELCEKRAIPLFRSRLKTIDLITELNLILVDLFAPQMSCHASFVEVHGLGMLIQGDSSIGKSETALGLIERGHTLIGDDIIRIKKRGNWLEGFSLELARHHMEVRGIGIINVAHLYGVARILEKKRVDIVVQLENWDDRCFYDRIGLEEKTTKMLGLSIPFYTVPIKPGRDVVLLLETLALNHRLKGMGYHSAKELDRKLLTMIENKWKKELSKKSALKMS